MSAVSKTRRCSFEEYLALEERAEFKSEFFDGEIFAMAGATSAHVKISSSILIALGQRLRGKPCQPMNDDMKIRIEATGLTTYPDVTVVCGEEQYYDKKKTVLINPTILVEV